MPGAAPLHPLPRVRYRPAMPPRSAPSVRAATLTGAGAILLWSLLALFTAASGAVPPFQLAAMTFLVGGLVGAAGFVVRPARLRALRQPARVWWLGVAGLFGYHALYFTSLRLAPPAEAGLVNYLWPLLLVLFSGLLPGEGGLRMSHLAGALLGLAGIAVLLAAAAVSTSTRRRCRATSRPSRARSSGRPIRCCRAGWARCRPTRSPGSASSRRR